MNLSEALKYGTANYKALPEPLQKSVDFINKVTKDGADLETYKKSEAIKKMIDLAVDKMRELAKKDKPKPEAKKPAEKSPADKEAKALYKTGQTLYTKWYGDGYRKVVVKAILKKSKGMVIPGGGASKPIVTFSYVLTNGDSIDEMYLTDKKPAKEPRPFKQSDKVKKGIKEDKADTWYRQAARILKDTYGLDPNDVDLSIDTAKKYMNDETPQEWLEWLANKHNLTPIHSATPAQKKRAVELVKNIVKGGKKLKKERLYLYEGKKYTEQELIDMADGSSTYDQWDNEAGPITTAQQAIDFLVAVKKIRKGSKADKHEAGNQVEHLPLEVQLMKRYINLNGKSKTPQQVMNVLDAVQKAIIEKRIGKKSQWATEIDEMQKRLIKAYKTMRGQRSLEVKIQPEFLEKLTAIVKDYEALKSVALIKRYINLDGEKQTKEKASRLLDQINKFLHDLPGDKYAPNLITIAKHLGRYIHGGEKELRIEEQSLSGLGFPWAMVARKALHTAKAGKDLAVKAYNKAKPYAIQAASAVKTKASSAYNKADDYLKKKEALGSVEKPKLDPVAKKTVSAVDRLFESQPKRSGGTFRPFGDIGLFLGDLEQNELGITIKGDKGSGKTQLCYQILNALMDNGKDAGFITNELPHTSSPMINFKNQYMSAINRTKLREKSNLAPQDALNFIHSIAPHLDVIAIDSWNSLKISNKEYQDLKAQYPNVIFILVLQELANGVTRGGNDIEYYAGINIETVKEDNTFKNNYATTSKNRYNPMTGLKYNIATQKLIP